MRSRSVHRFALVAAVLATMLALAVSCAEERSWTAWRTMPVPQHKLDGQLVRIDALPVAVREQLDHNCVACHQNAVDPHASSKIACIDCHGGKSAGKTKEEAHPRARHPDRWQGAANPPRSYTLLNDENTAWIRFVNPGDLRVANRVCGGCHASHTLDVAKSVMTTAAHFWGVASYANGIAPFKRTIFGESYSPEGVAQKVNTLLAGPDGSLRVPTEEEVRAHSYAPFVVPLPNFEATQPGNILRVFEQGSRLGGAALGQNGQPSPVIGIPDKLEDPGRPNNKLSDRGLGTLNRVDLPLLNVHKTRLNDPHLSFLGTNDQPGDYRSSGCSACHMVYANDRDPLHAGPYAQYGHDGQAKLSSDPTIDKNEHGHPLEHRFTNAIPSSQCMVCHMHQPNSFVNTFYGFQMWSYETDGEPMWPKKTPELSDDEWFERANRNPEGAARHGNWGDPKFLGGVAELNPELKHTQFADYHGHGWVFRGVFKTDKKGNLLDKDGKIVPYDDPEKFAGVMPALGTVPKDPTHAFEPQPGKPVHLRDIHAEKGMHCVDCHFSQDVHGDGALYAEYQAAVEITCQDCHGTVERTAELNDNGRLITSGPASKPADDQRVESRPMQVTWNGAHEPRFREEGGHFFQRSALYPGVEWELKQVKRSVTPGSSDYNPRAAYAKMIQSRAGDLAHGPGKMECHTCHSSWVTSCFGCHLPQEANVRSEVNHFEGGTRRNLASYNPQVARDDAFMLGIQGDVKGNRVGPVRSSSAVMISSKNAQREIVYQQQMTVAANGMSSQVFNTHFAHTVRKTETRTCSDCHVSAKGDNNAWLAQTYLLGTGMVNFIGQFAWVGERAGIEAVKVTEWEEPQAVIGSNLHALAYPEAFREHQADKQELQTAHGHHSGVVRGLQARGEYLFAACGEDGLRVYDIANIANKAFSEKFVSAPVSPLGQDTHVPSKDATAVALPTNNSISMGRKWRPENREQGYEYQGRKQNLHETYRYAYVTDREEGLIVVDVDCLNDGDPSNNFLERALTFDPDHALKGAVNLAVCGTKVYVCCERGLVVVDIEDPLAPRIVATLDATAIDHPTAVAVQLRYAFVSDARGVVVVDVTRPEQPRVVCRYDMPEGALDIYVARTYGYVAAGKRGLVILDLERPENPTLDQEFTADGRIDDLHKVVVGMTNDSTFAYLADGQNGLRVLSLISPADGGRSAFGFSPRPMPRLIATRRTDSPALALSRGLDRDRAVDESGHQVAVFGRIGGRPFTLEEMQRLYLNPQGEVYPVSDEPPEGGH